MLFLLSSERCQVSEPCAVLGRLGPCCCWEHAGGISRGCRSVLNCLDLLLIGQFPGARWSGYMGIRVFLSTYQSYSK